MNQKKIESFEREWQKLFGKCFLLSGPQTNWRILTGGDQSDIANHSEQQIQTDVTYDSKKNQLQEMLMQLRQMKADLNDTKSMLNDYDIQIWRKHTNFTNICSNLAWTCKKKLNAELCTKAWLKFCTILNTYELFPTDNDSSCFSSCHLCEAPGAFVTCLNHHITTKFPNLKWNWLASSLNPYYEGNELGIMINDDRFIKNTLANWDFGEDFTGDVMNLENLRKIMTKCGQNINLVTADGSIDCIEDPCNQEEHVAPLLYWEFITALNIMSPGASFVMKAFTILEEFTISMLYLLCCSFQEVHLCKPGPSKPGNSEVYIVCKRFHGLEILGEEFLSTCMQRTSTGDFTEPLVPVEEMPESFLTKLVECEKFFIDFQIQAINSNIDSFHNISKAKRKFLGEIKRFAGTKFVEEFHLEPILPTDLVTVSAGASGNRVPRSYTKEHSHNFTFGNFYERQFKKTVAWAGKGDISGNPDEVQETSPLINWYSKPDSQALSNDVLRQWKPILGKDFTSCRNTQFCSHYLMLDLFEARKNDAGKDLGSSTANTSVFESCNNSIDLSGLKELDQILGLGKHENIAVYESRGADSLEFEMYQFVSLAEAKQRFIDGTKFSESHGNDNVCQCKRNENKFGSLCHNKTDKDTSMDDENDNKVQPSCGSALSEDIADIQTNEASNVTCTCSVLQLDLSQEVEMLRSKAQKVEETVDIILASATQESKHRNYETSKDRLLLCLIAAMKLLRKSGTLICQIGDMFTNFNAGILYILSRMFARICIINPKQTDGISSRYLVCKDLEDKAEGLANYVESLIKLEIAVLDRRYGDKSIIHAIPIQLILQEEFLKYLKVVNELHSKLQIKEMER